MRTGLWTAVNILVITFAIGVIVTNERIAFAEKVSADNRPNIVFILVDDMGFGDPGCYNSESKIATPNIDSLAKDGMRFTDAHSAGPLCHMARYGLLTGQYPFRINVGLWPKQPLIEDGRATIASQLSDAGYQTSMVGKWHLGFAEDGYDKPLPGGPADRGFDSFFGIRASTDIPPYFYIRDDKAVAPPTDHIEAKNTEGWSPIQGEFWRAGGIAPGLELKDVLPRFTDEAIAVIDDHSKQDDSRNEEAKPLFLYLAYPAPHTPWLPDESFRGKSGAGMYGDFLMMVDHQIGRVLKKLEESGMAENSLVFFSSDNGPTWYPKDEQKYSHLSSGGYRGMKADAWEGGHRIPFIARWPEKIEPGSSSNQLISFVDMIATLSTIVEQPLPEKAGPDSIDFSRVLLGEQPADKPVRETLVVQTGNRTKMIRSGDWKLINQLGSGGFTKPSRIKPKKDGPKGQLYNLADDPGEQNNLWLARPDKVAELSRLRDEIVNAENKSTSR